MNPGWTGLSGRSWDEPKTARPVRLGNLPDTKKANFITSLRHAREEEIEPARKRGKVLRDRLKN